MAGSNSASFTYLNPRPFRQDKKRLKLLDLLAKREKETSVLSFSMKLTSVGGITSTFTVKKVMSRTVTVGDIARRLRAHNEKLKQKLSLFLTTPRLEYVDSKFRLYLPPRMGVYGKLPHVFALLGFSPSRLSPLTPLDEEEREWFGFFNADDYEPRTYTADEVSFEGVQFPDQVVMLTSMDDLVTEEEPPRNLEFCAFYSPPEETFEAHRNLGSMDTPEDVSGEIEPLLRQLETELNLRSGLLRVEPRQPGIAIYAFSRKSHNIKIELSMDEATGRLLNCSRGTQRHVIDLTAVQASSDGKNNPLVCGPVMKISKNALEPLLPLLLRVDGAPYQSYLSDVGAVHIIAFIDSDGGVFGTPFLMDDYQGTIEVFFHRRDLTPLLLQENLTFFAHFALVD